MKLLLTFLFITALYPLNNSTVIQRHDISPKQYEAGMVPEYLIDMPHEGHGVLIKPQWIVTVGHAIFYNYNGKIITIGDHSYRINKVVIHPEYKDFPKNFDYSNRKILKDKLFNRSDIALIKLSSPVKDRNPIEVYNNKDELGKVVEFFGKGATGDGKSGMLFDTKKQRKLRHGRNLITHTYKNWLAYKFDPPETSIPLEAIHGSGDSGGPSIIYINNIPHLAGLSSWSYEGKDGEYSSMLYGTVGYQVRVSSYLEWINSVVNNS